MLCLAIEKNKKPAGIPTQIVVVVDAAILVNDARTVVVVVDEVRRAKFDFYLSSDFVRRNPGFDIHY